MITEERQIKRDIERHFTNKLHRWCRDCDEVCKAADIRPGETVMLILIKMTTRALQSAMPKREFLELMAEAYNMAAQDNAEADRAQKSGRQL